MPIRALALAAGVAVLEEVVHRAVREGTPGAAWPLDLPLHVALAFPLAVVAVVVGERFARRGRPSRPPATRASRAAWVAALFGLFLVPAALLHPLVHSTVSLATGGEVGETGAHADDGHGTMAVESDPAVSHAVEDALASLPAAFALALLMPSRRVGDPRGSAASRVHGRGRAARRRPALAALALGVSAVAVGVPGEAAGSPPVAPFSMPLRIPDTVGGTSVALTAAETPVQVFPSGPPTMMWTFNGSFPGPTIEATSGLAQEVAVTNALPGAAGPITVHHHGEHAASEFDGQPHRYLIDGGDTYTYRYGYTDGGAGERGRLQWYHDHTMGVTGRNVWMGLAGMVRLRDPAEAAIDAALPNGARDVPLLVVDRTFDANNQLTYAFDNNGVTGDRLLVNGVIQPYFEVADVRYRLRILNASNTRSYTLALSDGRPLIHVATESGLLPAPVERDTILLGPAERAEVVVDFSGELGSNVVLQNLNGFGTNLNALMQFRVTRDEVDASTVPAALRAVPTIDEPVVATRAWVFGQDPLSLEWTINGHGYGPDTVDAHPKLGTTERWTFTNTTSVDHIVHIHDVHWQIASRSPSGGLASDTSGLLGEAGLRESFRLRPNEVVSLVSTFTDHLGRYVVHCHLLEHEDHSMMTQFEVVP